MLFEGSCDALVVPSQHGEIAVLAEHTPMIAALTRGEVVVRTGRARQVVATIHTGVIHVAENSATVLVDL